jgi:BirA family biotin operon repressor/biotin-[acetyl-CoA-carboxylase] ligase
VQQTRLCLEHFDSFLRTQVIGHAHGRANEVWDTLPSTNDRAVELASDGEPEGIVVIARQQTAGRGRHGRSWVSPPDSGIYLSLLLEPQLEPSKVTLITLAAGAAAAEAIEQCAGIKVGLKWVNDLVLDGRKLGGILAEAPGGRPGDAASANRDAGSRAPYVVLGIGLNVRRQGEVPEEIAGKACWLEDATRTSVDDNLLAASLVNCFEPFYLALKNGKQDAILSAWRRHSITLGKQIHATSGNTTVEGEALDIDGSGALIVRLSNGNTTSLHAGEITIRNADGTYA